MKDDQNQSFEEEIEKLKKERDEYQGNWKRALADYQNLQKRHQQEQQDFNAYITVKIFRQVMPIYDLLVQAQKHINDEGLKLVVKEFNDLFTKSGIKKIETEGKKFDPEAMDCVEVVPGKKDDEVVEELRSGFIFGDELIRPAMVKVEKKEESN